MTTMVLGTVGGLVGGMFGPVGAQIGFLAGSLLGNLIDPPKIEGPRRSDLKLQKSEYGATIPYVWGTGRIAGNVIDQTDLEEHEETSGGKGGPEVTTYTYSASFLVALAYRLPNRSSAILGVLRIWADGRLIWDSADGDPCPFTIYTGTATQEPDPTFEAINGVGAQPAYRDIAYAAAEDYMLTDFGDRIPLLEFEVFTALGDFPYRVSTFEPAPDSSGARAASYANGVITVGVYRTASLTIGIYYERRFDLQGNDLGDAYQAEVNLPGLPAWAVEGLNAATDGNGWWMRDLYVGAVTLNPFGPATLSAAFGGQNRVYNSEYIFAIGAGTISSDIGVARWPAIGGAVGDWSGIPDEYVVVSPNAVGSGDSLSNWVLGCTHLTDVVYVYHEGLGEKMLYEYSFDLQTLNRQWDLAALDAVQNIVNGVTFTVYRSTLTGRLLLACDRGNTGAKNLGVFYLNDDLTSEFVGKVDAINTVPYGGFVGGVTYLGNGYVLVADGVVSLEPPPADEYLYNIVNDLSSLTSLTGEGSPASDAYNTAELTDVVNWFAVGNVMTVRNALEVLRTGFAFDAVESDDMIVFKKRGATDSVVTVEDDDLCAVEYGSDADAPLITIREREQGMPRTVTLRYIDIDFDYQPGAQSSPRITTLSDSDVVVDVAIGFTASEALQKAWILQVAEWNERERFQYKTTRKYLWVKPCDVMTVRGRVIRVQKVTAAPNGVLTWEGVLHRPSLYTQNQTGSGSESWTPPTPATPRVSTQWALLDIPMVTDSNADLGFFDAMCRTAAGTWPGATMYYSVDDVTYTALNGSANEDIIGETTNLLGDFYGGNVVDETNSVTVELRSGATLSSCTLLQLLAGTNTIVIGDEILGYRTATLVATDTYTLTGLLRGRRGTESAMGTHVIGERVVQSLVQVEQTVADVMTTRYFKAITYGDALASATAEQFSFMGITARPYSPVQLGGGVVNGSGDVSLTWIRRTRRGGAWMPFADAALGETSEAYVVQIWNSSYTLCARIIEGVTSQATTYTSAQQVTDFGAQQEVVYFTVGQIGQLGIGEQSRGEAAGAGSTIDAPLSPIQPYQSGPSSPPAAGNSVNQIMTATLEYTTGFVSGNAYVVQFTTRASPAINGASWAGIEYVDAPCVRRVILSSDVNGATVLGTVVGSVPIMDFGPDAGEVALANSTTYYLIIRDQYADGTPSAPLGQDSDMRMTLLGVLS